MADKDYHGVVQVRNQIQTDEKSQREQVREQIHFLHDKDGQWDELAAKKFADRPRMQFDLTSPAIESIIGEIEQIEFGGNVIPTGGEATEEIAETYQKMCRTIANISDAPEIFQDATRSIASEGLDGWLITTDWADVDSFDQDILIERVPNAVDRIWIENEAFATRLTDKKRGFMDTFLSMSEYERKFPKGTGIGLGSERSTDRYYDQKVGLTVSDYYYIKETEKNLLLMSDGRVYDEEKYQPVAEDLARKGVQVIRERKRMIPKCFMRKMDGSGWLTKEQETVFSYIPLILVYGNKKTVERKLIYRGETLKLMDAQKSYNYAASREIGDGALAPVDKISATVEQVEGLEEQNRKLNTATDPMFIWKFQEGHPPPSRMGGPNANPQLLSTMQTAAQNIKEISRSHDPQQGQGLQGHSGKAYEVLNQKASTSAFRYIKPIKRAVADTFTIIVDAIPRIYDKRNRQMRLVGADGKSKFEMINEEVSDENGNLTVINDLSQGSYMFEVDAGPNYVTQRSEEADVLKEWAALDPSLIEDGSDILYGTMLTPGMKDIAERKRKTLVDQGRIPENQLTDKEREKIAQEIASQQNQPPNPLDEATTQAIVAQIQDTFSQMEERQVKMQLDIQEANRKMMETVAKIEKENRKLESEIDKTDSETLNNLREATGADAIVSPEVAQAYERKAEDLN